MTVTNQNSRDDYVSNGSATEYAFTFKILNEEDIQVIVTDLDGVEEILELTTDYTVEIDADSGLGNVELLVAATLNFKISLLRNMDFEQNTAIQNQGTSQFAGKSFEQALDKLTLLSQQLKEIVGRNIALKKSSLLSGITIQDPVANKILVVGADGNIEMSENDFTDIQADLQTIIDNLAAINAVADDISNINLVAADLTNIDIVAGIATAVNTVAAISAAVSTVASISSEVSAVAAISAAVSTVAAIDAAVSTVAGISGDVTTVAGISGDVTTVAGLETAINSVVANMASILNAASFGFPTLVSGDVGKILKVNAGYNGYELKDPSLTQEGTAITLSGTAQGYTGIPSWVREIEFPVFGASTNGTSIPVIQVGYSSGYKTTGYAGVSGAIQNSTTSVTTNSITNGFAIYSALAANVQTGVMSIKRKDGSSNTWIASGWFGNVFSGAAAATYMGEVTLSGTLDRIRLVTSNGTDTFDAGSINIKYK